MQTPPAANWFYDTWETATRADFRIVHKALETNVVGAWRLAAALVPLMREGRYGRIVNVSSEAGSLASMGAGAPAYAVSKAALNALTRVLAAELQGTGILVNSVCPGWVATDMGGRGGRPVKQGAAGIVWAATSPQNGPTEASSARKLRYPGDLDHPIRSDTGPARIGSPSVSTEPVTLYFPALTGRPARLR